jgi:hypothetical protein
MRAFNGECPEGMEIAHGDGDKTNPRLSNLRYATRSENQMDRVAHGMSNRGERHGMAKLTAQDVLTIREVIDETQSALAKRFGVTTSCIRRVLSRRTWEWL